MARTAQVVQREPLQTEVVAVRRNTFKQLSRRVLAATTAGVIALSSAATPTLAITTAAKPAPKTASAQQCNKEDVAGVLRYVTDNVNSYYTYQNQNDTTNSFYNRQNYTVTFSASSKGFNAKIAQNNLTYQLNSSIGMATNVSYTGKLDVSDVYVGHSFWHDYYKYNESGTVSVGGMTCNINAKIDRHSEELAEGGIWVIIAGIFIGGPTAFFGFIAIHEFGVRG